MYSVKEAYNRIGIKQNNVLNLIEMWNGGPTEAHLFVRKNADKYILCEEIHNFNSQITTKFAYALTNTNNLTSIAAEIEEFCKARYNNTLRFDFRTALDCIDVLSFFGL